MDEEPRPSPEEIRAIINSYDDFKYEEKEGVDEINCAICLDKMKSGNRAKQLQCKHIFHSQCINHWLKQKLRCPLCKIEVK